MVTMKGFFALVFLLCAGVGLHAADMIRLRDAIYEQRLTANQVRPIYDEVRATVGGMAPGAARYQALSRAEFFMGRALLFEEREREARTHFAEGLRLAEAALALAASAEGWVLRGENLAHLIQVSNWTFALANGLDVERFARNALAINPRNAAAQYLIAARWVFAPSPFNNINRGLEMMKAIANGGGDMARDDRFNVNSAIGWGYVQQRRYDAAIPWIQRALEVYPSNRFASDLLAAAEAGRGGRRAR